MTATFLINVSCGTTKPASNSTCVELLTQTQLTLAARAQDGPKDAVAIGRPLFDRSLNDSYASSCDQHRQSPEIFDMSDPTHLAAA